MKTATSMCAIQCRIAIQALSTLSHFMAVYARSFTGYILQHNSKGH